MYLPRNWLSVSVIISFVFCCQSKGQDLQLDDGATGIYLRLKQLQSTGSVLHVVAHPDDEDGAMLAYCARGLGVRTMLFSITRGEGGANMISSHFFDALGALRTLEHVKAASYYGNELFYSRAADYGYSKTLDEAMRQWEGGVPILEDLVEVIRRERPLVILSRFAGDPRDGHGHHQMAGVLSRLAFDAAADPNRFPRQIERGLEPWQVKKLYVRTRSRSDEANSSIIALPTGTYDPIIGSSYSQVARFGLGFQRSQGMSGHEGAPGPHYSYYRLAEGVGAERSGKNEATIFEGLDTSLSGVVENADHELLIKTKTRLSLIGDQLSELLKRWSPADQSGTLEKLSKQLVDLRRLDILRKENADHLQPGLRSALARIDNNLQQAIIAVGGLRLEAWATNSDGTPVNHATAGGQIKVHVRLANQNPTVSPRLLRMYVNSRGSITKFGPSDDLIQPASVLEDEVMLRLGELAPTKPYWRRDSIARPIYELRQNGQQRPMPPTPFQVAATVMINDIPVEIKTHVRIRQTHPEYGRVSYPLTIAPALNVRFPFTAGVLPKGKTEYVVPVVVQSCAQGKRQGTVSLELPKGWKSAPGEHAVSFAREDEELTVNFTLKVPVGAESERYTISAIAKQGAKEFREGFETVSARDVGRMNIYRNAVHRVQITDLKLTGKPKVAYIPGSGDEVADSLVTLGVVPITLSESDLARGDLSAFDVIIVGVRAYAVREDIHKHNARLLQFVKRGGVLIVQYQTPEFNQNFGPYPYEMGRGPEEVSEEDALVTILKPNHPLFNTPNKITKHDFDGWFEQRGSKFWSSWDDNYTALLECHDTGQAPQKGGMLIAKSGNGLYIYSAYAWYRQLPNGVPGAYRLFANMLSLPASNLVQQPKSHTTLTEQHVMEMAAKDWRYFDLAEPPPENWSTADFDDSKWNSGQAPLGYGDDHIKQKLSYGDDESNKHTCAYLRKNIAIDDPASVKKFVAKFTCDDGCVVYVNGQEVHRFNLPEGEVTKDTKALCPLDDDYERSALTFLVDTAKFTTGKNTIAVRVHQASAASSDLAFNMSLAGLTDDAAIVRAQEAYEEEQGLVDSVLDQ